MKSLITKIISVLTTFTLCIGLFACASPTSESESENCDNGHNLVQSSYTSPTCKTNGEEVYKCSRCGFESKKTLLTIDHDYKELSLTPSTCTKHGSKIFECSMCHETKTYTLPLKDHRYELMSETPSTCTVKGSQTFACKDCTDSYTNDLDLLKHDYQLKNTTPSTCVIPGSNNYECSVCHDKYSEEIGLLPHTLEKINTATCFTAGKLKNGCSKCDYEEIIEETDMLTHSFGTDGYCTECGIYETLFDEKELQTEYSYKNINGVAYLYTHGFLTPKFRENSTIPDNYWVSHIVTLTVSILDQEGLVLESRSFDSEIIYYNGQYKGKMTIQFSHGGMSNAFPNQFNLFLNDDQKFSNDNLLNCSKMKINISCEGYKTIEKTYEITESQ